MHARVDHDAAVVADEHRAPLDDLELGATLGAVHRDAVPLPRRVRVQRVAHRRAGVVVDERGEVVLDRDAGVEHVAVAQVAVVVLVVEVELLEVRVGGEVERERVAGDPGAARGPLAEAARRGVLGAVEPQAAAREHAHGRRGDPPVHEVEVVRRLVDEQPARVRLLPVPAAEVVGAVHRVERPLEVHDRDARRCSPSAMTWRSVELRGL